MTACCVGSAERICSFVFELCLCWGGWLSAAGDCVGSELPEGRGELLLPVVVEREDALGGLGSKKDGLWGCWVDIVIVEIILIRPERDTTYNFTLHSDGCLGRWTLNF